MKLILSMIIFSMFPSVGVVGVLFLAPTKMEDSCKDVSDFYIMDQLTESIPSKDKEYMQEIIDSAFECHLRLQKAIIEKIQNQCKKDLEVCKEAYDDTSYYGKVVEIAVSIALTISCSISIGLGIFIKIRMAQVQQNYINVNVPQQQGQNQQHQQDRQQQHPQQQQHHHRHHQQLQQQHHLQQLHQQLQQQHHLQQLEQDRQQQQHHQRRH